MSKHVSNLQIPGVEEIVLKWEWNGSDWEGYTLWLGSMKAGGVRGSPFTDPSKHRKDPWLIDPGFRVPDIEYRHPTLEAAQAELERIVHNYLRSLGVAS